MRLGLVLGGGGLVGLGYHAGVMKALDEFGADVSGADILVGTSAGSIIASYLASGWNASDFYEYAHGRHPNAVRERTEQEDEVRRIFTPMYRSQGERIRRGIGGIFALASSRGYWQRASGTRLPHRTLQRWFPSGMYSTEETRERIWSDLGGAEWPREGLYICAVELFTGRLVPFGHPDAPPAPLPDAVLASTAIPGVFPPVTIGDKLYVDGGAASATSLNLAADAGCDAILCIAPLGYKTDGIASPRDPRMLGPVLMRSFFARALRKEVNDARNKGIDVLVIRPWLTELRDHGTNSMRHFDRAAFAESTRQGALRLLEENSEHPALVAFCKKKDGQKAG